MAGYSGTRANPCATKQLPAWSLLDHTGRPARHFRHPFIIIANSDNLNMSSITAAGPSVAAEARSTPRRTLADLPAELKALIVEMASRQDERFRRRVACGPRLHIVDRAELSDGTSLRAVSEVNREWNALAAVELFQVSADEITTSYQS